MERYDTIVIGAGINGSSAAYHLAKKGQRVVLLEQFRLGHNWGSSHGESRIFRFAYADANYARFALQAYPLWKALEEEAGERLLIETGGLDIATERDHLAEIAQVVASLRNENCRFDEMDGGETMARFDQWNLPRDAHVVFSPDTAVLRADACVQALCRVAIGYGATLRDQESVERLMLHDGYVEVHGSSRQYMAERLVVAAGAWTNRLLEASGYQLPLQVSQEQTVYFQPRTDATAFVAPTFCVWIHHHTPETYGLPMIVGPDPAGQQGIKIGFHYDNFEIEIEDYARVPRFEVTERLHGYLEQFLPNAAGKAFNETACIYTNTPGAHFIIDTLPGHPNVAVGSACSGHGFKFGVATGKALAELLSEGQTSLQVSHCRFPD